MSVRLLNRAAIAAGVVGVAASAHAGFGTSYVHSSIGATGGNDFGGGISVAYLSGGYAALSGSDPLFDQGTFDFTGLDAYGETRTMSHSFEGAAQSDFGVLRSRITTNTSNLIYNTQNPDWIAFPSVGVPEYFDAQSYASFYDEVQVEAAAPVASVTVSLRVTGVIGEAAPGSYTAVAIWRALADGSASLAGFTNYPGEGERVIDEVVHHTFQTVNGVAPIGFGLQTWVASYLSDPYLEPGASFELMADAFNTLHISRIVARDVEGNVVQIESLMGSSGVDYTPFIPAPSAATLTLIGAACSLRRRRGSA